VMGSVFRLPKDERIVLQFLRVLGELAREDGKVFRHAFKKRVFSPLCWYGLMTYDSFLDSNQSISISRSGFCSFRSCYLFF
jgi:hypothetical protein